uniref:Uncharacterized protein n=1 Tax=Moniliophthora roreri TaxID=221103 RepID=A0A0W0GEP8_MONRR
MATEPLSVLSLVTLGIPN